jgi:hypothetical protein
MTVILRTRVYLGIISLFLVGMVLTSLSVTMRKASSQYEELGSAIGRSFFQEIAAAHSWNARHGGVYVPETETFRPNPRLDVPNRDVTTTGGLKLTLVNPAYMTRLISDLLKREEGIQLHITSLRPVNPDNDPDPWERRALEKFEKGKAEEAGLVGTGDQTFFRYMAPLKTGAACLKCHANDGYREGDIRGGISISFSDAPFLTALRADRGRLALSHTLFGMMGLVIIFFLGRKLSGEIREHAESLSRINRLEKLLPICSSCKKIRVPGGDAMNQESWEPVESYIRDRTESEFTHGICPECMKRLYPDFDIGKKGANND